MRRPALALLAGLAAVGAYLALRGAAESFDYAAAITTLRVENLSGRELAGVKVTGMTSDAGPLDRRVDRLAPGGSAAFRERASDIEIREIAFEYSGLRTSRRCGAVATMGETLIVAIGVSGAVCLPFHQGSADEAAIRRILSARDPAGVLQAFRVGVPAERKAALCAFSKMKLQWPENAPVLLGLFEDEDPCVRRDALLALERAGARGVSAALVEPFLKDSCPEIRSAAQLVGAPR